MGLKLKSTLTASHRRLVGATVGLTVADVPHKQMPYN